MTILLAAALLCAPGAAAAVAQEAPLLLRLPASARALGMGGVLPPGRGDAAALFYHPAFLRDATGIAGGMQWLGPDTLVVDAAGAMEWLGGAVGIGVRSVSYTGETGACDNVCVQLLRRVPVSERTAQVAVAHTVKGLRLALAGTYLEQRRDLARGSTWAADASLGAAAGPMRIGLTAQNLGPDMGMGSGGATVPLNRRLLLGVAAVGPANLGPLDILPAAQLAWERGARFSPAAGLELGYWPVVGRTFYLRAGARRTDSALRRRPFTAGAGFAGDRIGLDYALEPLEGGGAAHHIGIRWR